MGVILALYDSLEPLIVVLQAESELAKIDINCHIQGDVVVECVSLNDDMEREEMMFRVMFNTAFIRSNILILSRDEIDMMWNAKDQFPKDFSAEVFQLPDLFRDSCCWWFFLT